MEAKKFEEVNFGSSELELRDAFVASIGWQQFDLASPKLLPTTSLRLANVMRALRGGESQPRRRLSDRAFANADARNCDK